MKNGYASAIALLSLYQQELTRGSVAINLVSFVDTPQAQRIGVPIFREG